MIAACADRQKEKYSTVQNCLQCVILSSIPGLPVQMARRSLLHFLCMLCVVYSVPAASGDVCSVLELLVYVDSGVKPQPELASAPSIKIKYRILQLVLTTLQSGRLQINRA